MKYHCDVCDLAFDSRAFLREVSFAVLVNDGPTSEERAGQLCAGCLSRLTLPGPLSDCFAAAADFSQVVISVSFIKDPTSVAALPATFDKPNLDVLNKIAMAMKNGRLKWHGSPSDYVTDMRALVEEK